MNYTLLGRYRFDVRGTDILENVVAGRHRRRIFENQLTANSEIWGRKHTLFAFIASISLFLTEYTTVENRVNCRIYCGTIMHEMFHETALCGGDEVPWNILD